MNSRGFTLVEVLAMLVVLGIIVGISVPNIRGILGEQKVDMIIDDGLKMVDDTKTYVMTNKEVSYPSNNMCNIYTLDAIDKNEDIVKGPNGGKYSRTKSFVVATKVGKEYKYNVSLVEEISSGKVYGINHVPLKELEGNSKNFVESLGASTLVDFNGVNSLEVAKTRLGGNNVGPGDVGGVCNSSNLENFYYK